MLRSFGNSCASGQTDLEVKATAWVREDRHAVVCCTPKVQG